MRSAILLALFGALGCASNEPIDVAGAGGGGAMAGAAGSDTSTGGGWSSGGSGGDGGDCVAETLGSKLEQLPLDIIIYLDSSDSMDGATNAVRKSFDASFSQTLEASGVDYRVISISKDPIVTAPADPSRYFHYPRGTGSKEIPSGFLNTFDTPPAAGKEPLAGWSQWARPNASKALLAITDAGSGPTWTAAKFEQELFDIQQLPGFGSTTARNYRFHFMAGFAGNTPPGTPWLATDPIVTTATCAGVGKLGQELAILTGGLRFSMCDYEYYASFFQVLAQAETAIVPIECSFPVPDDGAGNAIDPNTLELEIELGGQLETLGQVHDESECASGGFWVESDQIHLCSSSCDQVQQDLQTELTIKHGCPTSFVPR